MINNVTLVGRLTKDPELKHTPSGVANCRFTLAVNRTFKNQNGEQEADFIQCVAWRKAAENLSNFQKKGSLIGIIGRIQTGSFEGQDGKRIYTTEVIAESIQFLESRNSQGNAQPQQQTQQPTQQQYSQVYQQQFQQQNNDPFAQSNGPIEVNEDDLPF
jgi:single-strand DNA-binding protein